MDGWGFYITNGTQSFGSTSSSTPLGGTLNLNVNTGNNKTLIMQYFYIINGTTQNGSATWSISNEDGKEFSLWNFFKDLSSYAHQGIFGITSFGLALIIFIIIMMTVGMITYKYGLTSPAIIIGVMFGVVGFLDAGLGLIPTPGGNYTGVATAIAGIIFGAVALREISQ